MILIDANILLYAYDSSAPQHPACREWLNQSLSEGRSIGLTWNSILSFFRISTDARVYRRPRDWDEVEQIVSGWLSQPGVFVLRPGDEHWKILSKLVRDGQARGPLIMDAHVAALAVEHGATLCTNDRDFTRFPGLRLFNPLAPRRGR